MPTNKERVELGANLLDEKYPTWFKHIFLGSLDMSHPRYCVLGQVGGADYENGLKIADITCDPSLDVTYGFSNFMNGEHNELTQYWIQEIKTRFDKDRESRTF